MSKRHYSMHRIVCWRLSRYCNRACDFCLSRSGPKFRHPGHDPVAIMRRLKELNVEKISYSGGEPLLYRDIERLSRLGQELGIRQTLTSNGDALTEKIPKWLDQFEYVNLSFDGDDVLHDQMMGKGHFIALKTVAQRLLAGNIVVGVNYMLTPTSLEAVPKFLQFCSSIGVNNVQFQTYIPRNLARVDGKYSSNVDGQLIDRLIEFTESQADKFPGVFKVHDYNKSGWFIVLDDKAQLTLPINGEQDLVMGKVFDEHLCLPNGTTGIAAEVLESIWGERLATDGIRELAGRAAS